jgi:two-component SAPR family response regulator
MKGDVIGLTEAYTKDKHMFLHKVTHVSLDSFHEKSRGKRIVLLYPWTNYRNLFLAYFLDGARDGLLYYRVLNGQENGTPVRDVVTDMVDQISKVVGTFGKKMKTALKKENAAAWGEALGADLAAYAKQPTVLYIDEVDKVTLDDDFSAFIEGLAKALPDTVQLAVSSRLLTYNPWAGMVASGDAIVLGTEQHKDDMMFTIEDDPRPQIEVFAFGRGHVLVNGQPITNWDGALPRNLFFFFMDRPLVTRDEIFSVFWPALTVKEATNVFHVTKRKITERINMKVHQNGSFELTQYNSGFYLPSEKVVRHYDVSDFVESVEKAQVATDEREQQFLYARAIDLYKAPFLQTIEMEWVQKRREQLRQMYAQALIGMGKLCAGDGDDRRAIGYLTRALKESPEREDIHRQVMSLYAKINMIDDAVAQFNHLKEYLGQALGIEPSRETVTLYDMIVAQRR